MAVSAIEYCTVGVSDMAAALALFHGKMALSIERDYAASPSLIAAWGLPPETAIRLVELSNKGHPAGKLRLAQYTPAATQKVRIHDGPGTHDGPADIGPKAIDFYVDDPIRPIYDALVAEGWPTRAEPVTHQVGDMISEEFVFWGPDGVPILLMVGHKHRDDHLRPGCLDGVDYSEIATISIIAEDLNRTRAFYGDVLGLQLLVDEVSDPENVDLANKLTGTAGTGIDWLVWAGEGEPSGKYLTIEFAGMERKRLKGRMKPGHLGFSLLSHSTPDIDALAGRIEAAGYPIMTKPTEIERDGKTETVMLACGPNEELFEFVQA